MCMPAQKPGLTYVEQVIPGLKWLFCDTETNRAFRSSKVADNHTTAHDVSQLLIASNSRRRRIWDASLATAWAASRRTIGHKP
eukprot:355039-Chlamydomonas_euryale.AAC.10